MYITGRPESQNGNPSPEFMARLWELPEVKRKVEPLVRKRLSEIRMSQIGTGGVPA